jgi:hypothetical protein
MAVVLGETISFFEIIISTLFPGNEQSESKKPKTNRDDETNCENLAALRRIIWLTAARRWIVKLDEPHTAAVSADDILFEYSSTDLEMPEV